MTYLHWLILTSLGGFMAWVCCSLWFDDDGRGNDRGRT